MGLSHLSDKGEARMVDVGGKASTQRQAEASGVVVLGAEVARELRDQGSPKGDVLALARVAGIMAAKKTPEIVPLCHPLALTKVEVDLALGEDRVEIRSRAACCGPTGVEMEALTAVAGAALCVYDMCKALSKDITIQAIRLESKSGGKSGSYRRAP